MVANPEQVYTQLSRADLVAEIIKLHDEIEKLYAENGELTNHLGAENLRFRGALNEIAAGRGADHQATAMKALGGL